MLFTSVVSKVSRSHVSSYNNMTLEILKISKKIIQFKNVSEV